MLTMDKEHIDWSRQHFEMLAEGAVWAVPRSGLVFQKQDGRLVLTMTMPWMVGMPITEDELTKQQDSEYQEIVCHFEAAGIKVIRDDAS